MRLGIISDTHDNLDKVRQAIMLFNRLGINQLVHCGDIVAPFILKEFNQLKLPLVLIYGNCDGDLETLAETANKLGFKLQSPPFYLQLGAKKIVVTHKPIEPLPKCDFYIHGHTHQLRYEPGKPVVINPGEACGWLTGRSTTAVLDIDKSEVEFFDL